MVSHTVMRGASAEILAPRPAAPAAVFQASVFLVLGLVLPIQIRVCNTRARVEIINRRGESREARETLLR